MSVPAAAVAETPRALWVELTSKCPLDCVFCSRKLRRGAGRHLSWEMYRELLEALVDPRRLVLNYSGESLFYPRLLDAVSLARSRGAFVELVSAFAAATPELARSLAVSGLGRLSASFHAADPARYEEIYGRRAPADLSARAREFMDAARDLPTPPSLDFSFVAMDRNLDQLEPVAAIAENLGVKDVLIFPVLRRDDIPERFTAELNGAGAHRPEFCGRLENTVTAARRRHPDVRITLSDPMSDSTTVRLGEVPSPCPNSLPEGARIHTCEQNPWETAHVLADGAVVPCEVLDRMVMGNLGEASLARIWHGPAYQQFRDSYSAGQVPECRACPWKRAYLPAAPASEILGARGSSAQLLRGWHEPCGEEWVWSTQQAAVLIAPRQGSHTLHVSGYLPPGLPGEPNRLAITCNGTSIGEVANPWDEVIPFGLDFEVPAGTASPWELQFRTRHMYRPSERGAGADLRDLGFAMTLIVSKPPRSPELEANRHGDLKRLARILAGVDRVGAHLRRLGAMRRRPRVRATAASGVSVLIPERDNPAELAECLHAVARVIGQTGEPAEVIVSASGACGQQYAELRGLYPEVRWAMSAVPLDFHMAVRRGLSMASYDWVYLLNNDAAPEPDALTAILPLRSSDVFAIGSQIEYKDPTRFREETNWGGFAVQNGLAAIADGIPSSDRPTECFYAGGGASLFRRALLQRLLTASSAYAPFYWEDVEWGWRARKLGYRVLFCPASVVRHRHRATIGRLYSAEEIERVWARNRVLFQLRNMTVCGSTDRLLEELVRLQDAEQFARRPMVWRIARARLWNWLAPVPDDTLLRDAEAMQP